MTPSKRLGFKEFVALMAVLFAIVALAIDAMLPALPQIAHELTPDSPNRAQLIVTSFVLGMGVGTFFTGPMADAWGRRAVILWGLVFYVGGAILAYFETDLERMLFARFLMGIGAAGPRVAAMAIVRDLYSGRMMAKLMSLVLVVFMLVPAIAPAIGAGVIALSGWREIFLVFVAFAGFCALWFSARQPETLAVENRRPLKVATLRDGLRDIARRRRVLVFMAVLALVFAMLFSMISSIQPIMDMHYGKGDSFPIWFALIAVVAGSSGFLNASLVLRLGMRVLVLATFAAQVVISGVVVLLLWLAPMSPEAEFTMFMVWAISVFFQTGLTVGNLNALAMEPLGHIAGLAASAIGAVSTVAGGATAIPLGLAFDGTPLPLALGLLTMALAGVALMRLEARLSDPVEPAPAE
ncbi:MAG: MFS transporter [Brevirhabdus sp.]